MIRYVRKGKKLYYDAKGETILTSSGSSCNAGRISVYVLARKHRLVLLSDYSSKLASSNRGLLYFVHTRNKFCTKTLILNYRGDSWHAYCKSSRRLGIYFGKSCL